MIQALFEYQFLQNALFGGILASIVCGMIGVIIVEKKLVMMSGGIAHTAYGGVGLGYLLGFEPIIGAFLFAVLSALAIGAISKKSQSGTDVIIGLFWSMGMALGILFIALMPGYPPDLSSYLFGNILSVTRSDLWLMFVITAVVSFSVIAFFNHWKVFLFDDEFAGILGLKTNFLDNILLILVAMTVVALIRVVGIILVIALLTAPAAIAAMITSNLAKRMMTAAILGVLFCVFGIYLSYTLNIASGAAIVLLSGMVYFLMFMVKRIRAKKGLGRQIREKNQ
ncbi:metal ABC transporter permease [Eubacteriaceae bacterium ES3]|nr:metal ABC transporter permease [Eubacteriaceae bacterium ES3]